MTPIFPKNIPKKSALCAPVQFVIEASDLNAHLFAVTLTIARPQACQQVALPVWIPGSYLVREFSKNLQKLVARQGVRSALAVAQLDKCTWQIDCNPAKPLVLRYEVFAHDNSVRSAWLDAERGFFNASSLCLRVAEQANSVHTLELLAPKKAAAWAVATGAAGYKLDKNGFGVYAFENYDELVDCPFELGEFWSGSFTARGVPHRFVVAGACPSFDGERLLAGTRPESRLFPVMCFCSTRSMTATAG
jgi:predicted metalloprotease with PDZ domain